MTSAALRKASLFIARTAYPVPVDGPGGEHMGAERPAEHLLGLGGGLDQLRQVHPGLDPHLLQHRDQVLGRDVPGRARRHRAAAELAEGALEGVDPGLERGEHVGEALAAGVVEVGGQLDLTEPVAGGGEELADLARVRHPGRVAEGDLLAAEAGQLPGDLEDAVGRHLALVGTAEAGRDHALAADAGLARGADRPLQVRERLGDRAVDVLAVVGLRGREEEVGLLEAVAVLERVLQPLAVRDQHRVGDAVARLDPRPAPRRRRRAAGSRRAGRTRSTSIRFSPASASIPISRTLSSVGITSGSFWNPSRGPTSRIRTVSGSDQPSRPA